MDRPLDAPPLRWFAGDAAQRAAARRYWLADTAAGLGHMAIHHTMRAMPIDLASGLGDFVGRRIARPSLPDAERQARENWARLRPEDDPDKGEAAAAFAFGQNGRVQWEFAVLDRLRQHGRIAIAGGENVTRVHAEGRPIVVIGVHLSNWEVLGPALMQLGLRPTGIYQPPPNRFDHRIVVASRYRWGGRLVPSSPAGARQAVKLLQARDGVIGMYVDECIDGHVYAPFFGRPFRTEGNIARAARFAALTDAAIIPSYALRRDGLNFDITFLPALDLARGRDREADLAANVALINATYEPIIRRHLEQWFWLFDLRLDR